MNSMPLAISAALEIHNVASMKPMPECYLMTVRIIERALLAVLEEQREALLRQSDN